MLIASATRRVMRHVMQTLVRHDPHLHLRHVGGVVDTQGGPEAGVKARIGKVRLAFLQMKSIW